VKFKARAFAPLREMLWAPVHYPFSRKSGNLAQGDSTELRNLRPPPRSSLRRHLNFNTVATVALLLALVLISIVAYLPHNTHAQNAPATATNQANNKQARDKKAEFVPGELLVRFRPDTAPARNKTRTSLSIASSTGRNLRVEVNHFGGSELVEGLMLARVAPEDTLPTLNALRARADVVYAEPNFIRHADLVPNDTHYAQLWALKNSNGGISAESAWNTTTGSHSVVVGVIDSGIDISHHDLKDNIFVNTGETPGNNIDDDNNGFIDDVNGWDFLHHDRTVFDSANEDFHGTHVAGTLGAQGNNAAGVVGVNWDVQLLPMKALGLMGTTDSTLLEAYSYAKMMRQRGVNLRVLNNSYGGQRFSQSLLEAIKQLGDAGILFIAAAGNDTLNNDSVGHFPATYDLPNVISVAASAEGGFLASSFSNRGPQTVHLAAPGQNILSTTPRGYTGDGLVSAHTEPDGSTYSNFSGTSMASPQVAGAAALACAANPSISFEKLRAAVLFGVDESFGFTSTVITSGRLNANKVVQFALEDDSTPPAPVTDFRIESQTGRRVELRWRETGDDGATARASLNEIRFIDSVSGEQFRLFSAPAINPAFERTVFVNIPLKHANGQLSLRTFDNVGNTTTATVNVTLAPDVADPYTVTLGPAATLTAPNSGNPLGFRGDDVISSFQLPFQFPFFGLSTNQIGISSNGALYILIPPDSALPNPNFGPFDFAIATETNFEGLAMIAGMWADLRTDRSLTDAVYVVQPDIDHIIFRWQGVTFGTETPVNFEIELRRDGTIQTRYGAGNQNLKPVLVGISGGDPEGYLVASHSSESSSLSLTNAQSVTFALKNPPPPPVADLSVSVTASPAPVISGQNLTYNVHVTNLGPNPADLVVMTDVLPAGTTFVSCMSHHFSATCTNGPAGTVIGKVNPLHVTSFDSGITFSIVVKVDAAGGASLQNNVSVTSFRPDPNPANNAASVISHVAAQSFLSGVRAIAAGDNHTSSVRSDGTVWTWGNGAQGQLGDGTGGFGGSGVRTLTPLQVPGLDGVVAVEENNSFGFVLALKSNGTVWGWGNNFNSQIDDTRFPRTRPVQIIGLTNVKGIAAGDSYAAAVKTDGTVWIWGATGVLLDNNFSLGATPVQLSGVANVAAIAAGSRHLLMLKTDKTVWALGGNSMGQLGNGATANSATPVQVTGLTNVARIAAGPEFSLAVKEDGTVWAWGLNSNGQLGPGGGAINFAAHPNAVQVTGLPAGITNLAAGESFCLALASDGTVWSWGNNASSQLGHGAPGSQNPTPGQVPNFANVTTIAAGTRHSVALKTDGSVWGWGLNLDGELGDGSSNIVTLTPVRVSGLETVNAPAINPLGGKFFNALDVTITSPTPGATIHFTINANEPTESDPVIASGGKLHITTNSVIRTRAWKPGLVPSSTSFAGFELTAPSGPPVLFMNEDVLSQLPALDSLSLTTDPFSVVNPANLLKQPNDPNTRVILFVLNLELFTGETAASVTVNLTDANGLVHNLPALDVRPIPNGLGFSQVTFRLPSNLPVGTCQVKLTAHNLISNIGTIRIKQ
jgi:uncharacterized repeat protein (TIGR01451 family)